jgi:hypothetical protein
MEPAPAPCRDDQRISAITSGTGYFRVCVGPTDFGRRARVAVPRSVCARFQSVQICGGRSTAWLRAINSEGAMRLQKKGPVTFVDVDNAVRKTTQMWTKLYSGPGLRVLASGEQIIASYSTPGRHGQGRSLRHSHHDNIGP